ncbi:hypothetical protein [Flavobacterium sp. ZS1P14]|uniref:hypothetical protein n=1 Tax=Flavobacterium sp. ZS1P14 TaxID=3401729 RepID=UPI003AACE789
MLVWHTNNIHKLLQGGVEGWFKTIGPNAGRAMQSQLAKQGGQIMPTIQKTFS